MLWAIAVLRLSAVADALPPSWNAIPPDTSPIEPPFKLPVAIAPPFATGTYFLVTGEASLSTSCMNGVLLALVSVTPPVKLEPDIVAALSAMFAFAIVALLPAAPVKS